MQLHCVVRGEKRKKQKHQIDGQTGEQAEGPLPAPGQGRGSGMGSSMRNVGTGKGWGAAEDGRAENTHRSPLRTGRSAAKKG